MDPFTGFLFCGAIGLSITVFIVALPRATRKTLKRIKDPESHARAVRELRQEYKRKRGLNE